MAGGNDYSHFRSDRQHGSEGLRNLFSPTINGKSIIETQRTNLANRIKDAENVFNSPGNPDNKKLSEADAAENLLEAVKSMVGSLEQAIENYDSLLNTIDELSSKMDDLIDDRLKQYDKNKELIDSGLNQVKLMLGNTFRGYIEQSQLYQQRIETDIKEIKDIRTAIKATAEKVKQLEDLERDLKKSNKELSTEERETLQNARDKLADLQIKLNEEVSKGFEDIVNNISSQANADMRQLSKDIFGNQDAD